MHMHGHHPLSVAVKNGLVAVGIQANVKTDPGAVAFYDTDGNPVAAVTVSSMPDMVTFTPDGKYVLAAIEGEPADNLSVDPEGAVAIIDVRGAINQLDVVEANFLAFNTRARSTRACASIRPARRPRRTSSPSTSRSRATRRRRT